MRKISVVAASLFIIPSPALAADWMLAVSVEEGFNIYVDASSIKSNGPIRRYWTRTDYWGRSDHVNDPDRPKETKMLHESNCATDQRRVLESTIYKIDGTNSSRSYPSEPWKYITPDTVGERLHYYVCVVLG